MSKVFYKNACAMDLQNTLQTRLPEDGVAASQNGAMTLCEILFSSLYIDAARMQRWGDCVVVMQPEDENLL